MRAFHSFAVVVMGCLSLVALPAEAAGKSKKAPKTHVVGTVNLNTASAQQLDLLPGIGESAAKRIVEYRSKTPFTRVEELVKVKGFGKKRFEKLKPFLAVAGPTSLKKLPGPAPTTAGPEKPDLAPAQGRTGRPLNR